MREGQRVAEGLGFLILILAGAAVSVNSMSGNDEQWGLINSTQPLMAGRGSSGTIPALPVQSETASCELDLSDELFGGVKEACGGSGKDASSIDRSRCCPVVAAWLYAAHARNALKAPSPSQSPYLVSSTSSSLVDMPVLPDDSLTCANTLQNAFKNRGINIPQPNASCDPTLCVCGIRLHQMSNLNCPESDFGSSKMHNNSSRVSGFKMLERSCKNPSYAGCSMCLNALHKLNMTKMEETDVTQRTSRMYIRDCELMGLIWLLGKNKTSYIPTVSAVLRAIMYSSNYSECSPDKENMPLAVDSTQLDVQSAATASILTTFVTACTVWKVAAFILVLLLLEL